jgi:hypothetical protein
MAGTPLAFVGFEATRAIEEYFAARGLDMSTLAAFKALLRDLEQQSSLPLGLVRVASETETLEFICCYASSWDGVYDCEDLLKIGIPPQFSQLRSALGVVSDVKRQFAANAKLFSYDDSGKAKRLNIAPSMESMGITVCNP